MCRGPAALLLATDDADGDVELALAVWAGADAPAAELGAPGELGVVACW